MPIARLSLIVLLVLAGRSGYGQGTAPTFRYTTAHGIVTLPGRDPAHSGTTLIPTVLVLVRLQFDSEGRAGKALTLDAGSDVAQILHSPVFSTVPFAAVAANAANRSDRSHTSTQYVDAMLRATIRAPARWHTLLGKPEVRPVTVEIPAGYGYVLTSKRTGTRLGIADAEFVQRAIFRQLPRQDGKLVIAVSHNTAYYTYGDATVCCSWGTHGVDRATRNSFVLASYMAAAPPIVEERDVQPLTGQLAEWVNDPLHDPLFHVAFRVPPPEAENVVPAWKWPSVKGAQQRGCGGSSPADRYTLQSPLDTNQRSDLPAGPAWAVRAAGRTWHLANMPLMSWYMGASGPYSFPDSRLLLLAADRCPVLRPAAPRAANQSTASVPATAVPSAASTNGHELIGYWTGAGPGGTFLRLRDVSPQWDVILVAFANVNHQAPEGTMQMHVWPSRPGQPPLDIAQMKDDIAWLRSHGRKVMISLGGGGETFTLDNKASIPAFVDSVTDIVTEYGFDGIDLDFETPSLVLDQGDTDFRHPKTPSTVNLIAALKQLRDHFGPRFMLSLVPEGTQLPAGYVGYGGQFGSYLPLLWGVRDILSFVDVQDYNTPPFEGLDGEIYQLGAVDYDAAMTELVLQGFPVDGRGGDRFPAVPANEVAAGFLVGTATPELVSGAMQYLITGNRPKDVTYKLRQPNGYPEMIGAMFWTIDEDLDDGYSFSKVVGPQLHGYPAVSEHREDRGNR